jgi:hypothetical protein
MLGLYRLDDENPDEQKNLLPPPQDWIELEERRRTFWAAFYHDRWASSATGWPMTIDDDDVSGLGGVNYISNQNPDLDGLTRLRGVF